MFPVKAVISVTHLLAHGLHIFAVSLWLLPYAALNNTNKLMGYTLNVLEKYMYILYTLYKHGLGY